MTRTDWQDLFEGALRQNPPPTDAVFRARKNAARGALQEVVAARGRRRAALRAAAAVLIVLGIGAAAVVFDSDESPVPVQPEIASPSPDGARPAVQVAHTIPGVVERMSGRRDVEPLVVRIDDRELARLLRATGAPPGVVRTPDRVLLAADLSRAE